MKHKPESVASNRQNKEMNLEIKIAKILHKIGISPNIRGYYYMSEAIMMVVNDSDVINYVTEKIYGAIARRYNAAPSSVERAMRHAIEGAWKRGNIKVMDSFFGYSISARKGRPTVSQFIASIANRISLELRAFPK